MSRITINITYWAIETVTKEKAQVSYSVKEWAKIERLASATHAEEGGRRRGDTILFLRS